MFTAGRDLVVLCSILGPILDWGGTPHRSTLNGTTEMLRVRLHMVNRSLPFGSSKWSLHPNLRR